MRNIIPKMVYNTFQNLNCDNLFLNFNEYIKDLNILESHKYILIKLIITFYFEIKLSYEDKVFTVYQ